MRKCSLRRYKGKKWAVLLGTAAVVETLWFGGTAMAAGIPGLGAQAPKAVIAREWMNMNLGPGVAQWVDENGNVTETPGVKPGAERNGGQAGENGQGTAGQGSEGAAGQNSQGAAGQNSQGPAGPGAAAGQEPAGPGEADPAVSGQEQAATDTAAQNGRVIDPEKPMVALTFDDGPFSTVGNRIMDCLAQYGGKATFYVVGNRCASYKEEMQRMVAEGHEIGNHTYSHKYLNKLGAAEIQSQIQKGNEAIQAAAGVGAATVRLPGGNKNDTVLANVNAPMIMWSIDTLDWKTKDAQKTVDAVLNHVKDGDIVLMHELYNATGDAALQIIPALVDRGYQLVTVSEMANCRGGLEAGKVYYHFRR